MFPLAEEWRKERTKAFERREGCWRAASSSIMFQNVCMCAHTRVCVSMCVNIKFNWVLLHLTYYSFTCLPLILCGPWASSISTTEKSARNAYSLAPDLLSQNHWERCPGICILPSPPVVLMLAHCWQLKPKGPLISPKFPNMQSLWCMRWTKSWSSLAMASQAQGPESQCHFPIITLKTTLLQGTRAHTCTSNSRGGGRRSQVQDHLGELARPCF